MSKPVTVDRIGTLNEQKDLSNDVAAADLARYLADSHAEIVALQEWPGHRNGILQGLPAPWKWVRHPRGGGPVIWRADRYQLLWCRAKTLAPGGWVGRLPGRKSTLPASVATVVCLYDELLDEQVIVVCFHLTAEVQKGKGYRKDPAHALRVARHVLERRRLGSLARRHKRRLRRVYACGDGNFDGLRLRGFVSCWAGRQGATLGDRAVDVIFATVPAETVRAYRTRSDHRAVCATYPRKRG